MSRKPRENSHRPVLFALTGSIFTLIGIGIDDLATIAAGLVIGAYGFGQMSALRKGERG